MGIYLPVCSYVRTTICVESNRLFRYQLLPSLEIVTCHHWLPIEMCNILNLVYLFGLCALLYNKIICFYNYSCVVKLEIWILFRPLKQ